MNVLKTYEEHIIKDENVMPGFGNRNVNYEEEFDAVIFNLSKHKEMISMLRDTIDYVCKEIQKTLPDNENFMNNLKHYDDEVFECVDNVMENMIHGYPNMKDIIEEVEKDFEYITNFIKNKK